MLELSRAERNCNPGNIRLGVSKFRGEYPTSQDAEFKQFEAPEWGYRAMFLILHNYGILYGIDTLDRMIARWAPAVENETHLYIKAVAKRLGMPADSYIDTLDHDVMVVMVAAMSRIESGKPADMERVELGWRLFRGEY